MAVYKFAGFWRRLVAYTVDNIIINIVFFILAVIITIAFIFGSISGKSTAWLANLTDPARIASIVLLATAFYVLISIAYFTYFHGIKGRTPGKMLLGLQVLSAEGTSISFGTAFLRSVGYLVSSIFYIGFIWAAFDKRKQGWHDKIAGTVVIIRPAENEAAGITIPEPQAFPVVPQTGENKEMADQPGINDQKIP